jgi:hypothetical protein
VPNLRDATRAIEVGGPAAGAVKPKGKTMMLRKMLGAAVVAAVVTALPSLPALADQCVLPPPPSKLPDGATASKQDMLNAMNTLKEYNGDVSVYLKCLDFETRENRMSADVSVVKHNAAVTQLQAIADKFNQQVRIFKSKHS